MNNYIRSLTINELISYDYSILSNKELVELYNELLKDIDKIIPYKLSEEIRKRNLDIKKF